MLRTPNKSCAAGTISERKQSGGEASERRLETFLSHQQNLTLAITDAMT